MLKLTPEVQTGRSLSVQLLYREYDKTDKGIFNRRMPIYFDNTTRYQNEHIIHLITC